MKKITKADLDAAVAKTLPNQDSYIKVGMSSCGIAAGADEVFNLLLAETKKRNIAVAVKPTGCGGACYAEPLVEVCITGLPAVTYGKVNLEIAMRILDEHVEEKRLVHDYIVDRPTGRKN